MDVEGTPVRRDKAGEGVAVAAARAAKKREFASLGKRSFAHGTNLVAPGGNGDVRDHFEVPRSSLHHETMTEEEPMVQLRKSVAIDAPPDAVWAVLGDLAATTEWLPGTVAARMDGSTRICTTVDGFEIREEISDYAPESYSYGYRHLAVPLPIKNSSGSFTVEARNGSTEVVLEAQFEALDATQEAEVGQMFGGALEQSLAALKRRVEEGQQWDAH